MNVTAEERQKLESWVRRPKTAQGLALRVRIVLQCARGILNQEVARELGLDVHTVGKWRERFRISRMEGLADEPRPGAPRRISDEQIEKVLTFTLGRQPAHGTHWSTADDGSKVRLVTNGCIAHLASLRIATAPE